MAQFARPARPVRRGPSAAAPGRHRVLPSPYGYARTQIAPRCTSPRGRIVDWASPHVNAPRGKPTSSLSSPADPQTVVKSEARPRLADGQGISLGSPTRKPGRNTQASRTLALRKGGHPLRTTKCVGTQCLLAERDGPSSAPNPTPLNPSETAARRFLHTHACSQSEYRMQKSPHPSNQHWEPTKHTRR